MSGNAIDIMFKLTSIFHTPCLVDRSSNRKYNLSNISDTFNGDKELDIVVKPTMSEKYIVTQS